jgi:glycosyltransferase involved in cell wall biosynthesis
VQDIYPDIAVQVGVRFIPAPIAWIIAITRNWAFRRADATVVIGHMMLQFVQRLGISSERVHLIPNWCNDQDVRPLSEANLLREKWGLGCKFVVGYSGNLGRVHECETVKAAARLLSKNSDILFLMIGTGTQYEQLAYGVKELKLETLFRFVPYQTPEMLKYSLSVPDAHWISLHPNIDESLVFPSKFYGAAAAGKPLIIVGKKNGELARLVQTYGCGFSVEHGDARAFADTVVRLANEPETVARMGRCARTMLESEFTREKGFERWRRLLSSLKHTPGANDLQ